ncbi:hypothetical protein [Rossellomorea marisflavi]|uniref:hypothetical protein n=1 Tax=Rossellomorea marisflavi TaxID=189381 RepID=UPI00345D1507
MRYEVTWMEYLYDWETQNQEQTFTSEQFESLENANLVYENKKVDLNVEHVKISVILAEFSK